MAHLVPLLTLLAVGAAPPDDVEATSEPAPSAQSTSETSLLAGIGFARGATQGGLGLTLLLTHRLGPLELGVDWQGVALSSSMLGVGAVAGLHFGDDASVRLLASAGKHYYAGVGREFLGSDPGVSWDTPYVGGRALLGYSLARRPGRRHRGFVGAMVGMDRDLSRTTKQVTYTEVPWLLGEPYQQTRSHRVGQTTYSAFFVAGVELDFMSY